MDSERIDSEIRRVRTDNGRASGEESARMGTGGNERKLKLYGKRGSERGLGAWRARPDPATAAVRLLRGDVPVRPSQRPSAKRADRIPLPLRFLIFIPNLRCVTADQLLRRCLHHAPSCRQIWAYWPKRFLYPSSTSPSPTTTTASPTSPGPCSVGQHSSPASLPRWPPRFCSRQPEH